jgi:hypothetical protein
MRSQEMRRRMEGFSPYMGNKNNFSYLEGKKNDEQLLRCTLKNYETPFNNNNEGYYNKNIDVLVPLNNSKILTCKNNAF